eukprot:gene1616-1178_t
MSKKKAPGVPATGGFISFSDVTSNYADDKPKSRYVTSTESNVSVLYTGHDPVLTIACKRLLKKDINTKLKSIQEIVQVLAASKDGDESVVGDFMAFFAFAFSKLLYDDSVQVRLGVATILSTVCEVNKKALAPAMEELIGGWWQMMSDPTSDVAQRFRSSFTAAFPPKRRHMVVHHLSTRIFDHCVKHLALTASELQALTQCSDDDLVEKYERVTVACLGGLTSLLEQLTPDELTARLFDEDHREQRSASLHALFKVHATSASSEVKKALGALVTMLLERQPTTLRSGSVDLLRSFCLENLDERATATVLQSALQLLVTLAHRWPQSFERGGGGQWLHVAQKLTQLQRSSLSHVADAVLDFLLPFAGAVPATKLGVYAERSADADAAATAAEKPTKLQAALLALLSDAIATATATAAPAAAATATAAQLPLSKATRLRRMTRVVECGVFLLLRRLPDDGAGGGGGGGGFVVHATRVAELLTLLQRGLLATLQALAMPDATAAAAGRSTLRQPTTAAAAGAAAVDDLVGSVRRSLWLLHRATTTTRPGGLLDAAAWQTQLWQPIAAAVCAADAAATVTAADGDSDGGDGNASLLLRWVDVVVGGAAPDATASDSDVRWDVGAFAVVDTALAATRPRWLTCLVAACAVTRAAEAPTDAAVASRWLRRLLTTPLGGGGDVASPADVVATAARTGSAAALLRRGRRRGGPVTRWLVLSLVARVLRDDRDTARHATAATVGDECDAVRALVADDADDVFVGRLATLLLRRDTDGDADADGDTDRDTDRDTGRDTGRDAVVASRAAVVSRLLPLLPATVTRRLRRRLCDALDAPFASTAAAATASAAGGVDVSRWVRGATLLPRLLRQPCRDTDASAAAEEATVALATPALWTRLTAALATGDDGDGDGDDPSHAYAATLAAYGGSDSGGGVAGVAAQWSQYATRDFCVSPTLPRWLRVATCHAAYALATHLSPPSVSRHVCPGGGRRASGGVGVGVGVAAAVELALDPRRCPRGRRVWLHLSVPHGSSSSTDGEGSATAAETVTRVVSRGDAAAAAVVAALSRLLRDCVATLPQRVAGDYWLTQTLVRVAVDACVADLLRCRDTDGDGDTAAAAAAGVVVDAAAVTRGVQALVLRHLRHSHSPATPTTTPTTATPMAAEGDAVLCALPALLRHATGPRDTLWTAEVLATLRDTTLAAAPRLAHDRDTWRRRVALVASLLDGDTDRDTVGGSGGGGGGGVLDAIAEATLLPAAVAHVSRAAAADDDGDGDGAEAALRHLLCLVWTRHGHRRATRGGLDGNGGGGDGDADAALFAVRSWEPPLATHLLRGLFGAPRHAATQASVFTRHATVAALGGALLGRDRREAAALLPRDTCATPAVLATLLATVVPPRDTDGDTGDGAKRLVRTSQRLLAAKLLEAFAARDDTATRAWAVRRLAPATRRLRRGRRAAAAARDAAAGDGRSDGVAAAAAAQRQLHWLPLATATDGNDGDTDALYATHRARLWRLSATPTATATATATPTATSDARLATWAALALQRTVLTLPALTRAFWASDACGRRDKRRLAKFVEDHVRGALLRRELAVIAARSRDNGSGSGSAGDAPAAGADATAPTDAALTVVGNVRTGQITASFVHDEVAVDLTLTLPAAYPLKNVDVSCTRRVGVSEARWRRWVLQMIHYLSLQDGTVYDAAALWQSNLQQELAATSAYIAIMCYNVYRGNALYTFGDLVATVVQNSLIVLLILYYGPMGKGFPRVFLAQFAGLCLVFLVTVAVCCVARNALQYLVIYGSAVGVVSRGSQVYHNTRRETVLGVQSPLTAVNSFVRPCIKLYYAATVTHDGWLIASNVVNVLLNFLLLLQVCWWLPQRQRVRDEQLQLQQKRR